MTGILQEPSYRRLWASGLLVNVARWVADQLVKDGKVQRAYLGVGIQPLDQDLADQLGVATPGGALVTDVQPDSPAAAAGLKSQDVITSFNGTPIASHRQLSAVVGRTAIGKSVPVVVYRDGKEVKLNVTVEPAAGTLNGMLSPFCTPPCP